MTKVLMVQGTMSNVGKSVLVAGLCRIFRQDGLSVAPFKSQNMALNSFATREGLEIGRAQAMQAEAAGIDPSVYMNPVLLKPTSDEGSQVIVNGRPIGNMAARDYFAYKQELVPLIREAFAQLAAEYDVIVIEGAGSPAEINLRENDIVNMGLAEMVDAPVLLVGDIDRGGVFAQLLGTLMLLTEAERERVAGLVINKFRGDVSLLASGIEMLEQRGGIPVVGTVPYADLHLEDEDSLTERFARTGRGAVDIAVVRLPRISNFSDFDVFDQIPDLTVRFPATPDALGDPDLLILPGSKNTIADMKWLRESGWETAIQRHREAGRPIFGICGGYQMLGETIADPEGLEGGGSVRGLGLLPVRTVLAGEKKTVQREGRFGRVPGIFAGLSGLAFTGYEIHMGETLCAAADESGRAAQDESCGQCSSEAAAAVPLADDHAFGHAADGVYGTYIHGIFDRGEIAAEIARSLAVRRGVTLRTDAVRDHRAFKEEQYDRLAEVLRAHLDLERIRESMREARIG